MSLDECEGVLDDGSRIRAVAASVLANGGVLGIHVEVDHRRKIEIEAEVGQGLRGETGVRAGGLDAYLGQLLGRPQVPEPELAPQAPDPPSFLVHGHEQWTVGRVSQLRDEALHLFGRVDVATQGVGGHVPKVEDHATQVSDAQVFEDAGIFGETPTPEAHHQHLPDLGLEVRVGRRAGREKRGGEESRGEPDHDCSRAGLARRLGDDDTDDDDDDPPDSKREITAGQRATLLPAADVFASYTLEQHGTYIATGLAHFDDEAAVKRIKTAIVQQSTTLYALAKRFC